MTPKMVYSVDEVASVLGVSRSTVIRLINDGEIRTKRAGTRILIPVSAVEDFLNRGDL